MTDQDTVTYYLENAAANRPQCHFVFAWLPRIAFCHSPLLTGWIALAASELGITRLLLPKPSLTQLMRELEPADTWRYSWTPLLCRTYWQVRAYFSGQLKQFDIPVDLREVSDFRAKILHEAQSMPRGETCSYAELAAAAGSPRASRAVGQAMASNPVPLLVPCHRVIGSDGSMVGFGGGTEQKLALLRLEGVTAGRESV